MKDTHGRRLFASFQALEALLRQIENAARQGISPTSGENLSPLAPEAWSVLSAPMEEMRDRLRAVVHQVAPDLLANKETPRSRASTYRWLLLLLLQLESDVVDDLNPGSLSRYGTLDKADRERLEALVEGMRADIARARVSIVELQQSDPPPTSTASPGDDSQ